MPRRLRIHVPGGIYHVTLRGNHKQPIFFEDGDRSLLNIIVTRALANHGARLHAYCWMTNHLHLFMQAGTQPISRPMHDIAAEFARAQQIKLATTGHFFERRYHATLVDADRYMLELLRYVHRNPVTAGMASCPAAYAWSSHHEYSGARSCDWVTTGFALRMFATERTNAIAAYLAFVNTQVDDPWEPAQAMVSGKAVLGDDDFIARVTGVRTQAKQRQSLDELIEEACQRFGIAADALISPIRDSYAAKVRGWIACRARQRGIAPLAAVARKLGRTEGALRFAIRAHPEEME